MGTFSFFDPSDFFSTRGLKSPEDFEKEATRIEGKNAVLSLKYGTAGDDFNPEFYFITKPS